MIATIAVIAAIAETKKVSDRSDHSDHMETTFQRSLREQKIFLSDRCRCDRWKVVSL